MTEYIIQSTRDQSILFHGTYASFKSCLEDAVIRGVYLHHADLRHCDLSNANLDDARLEHADFTGSNLDGINLSEARLAGCIYRNATLYNACLACSDLSRSDFRGAHFGATDIAAADFSHSLLDTPACARLDLIQAAQIQGCVLEMPDSTRHTLLKPPVVISGLTPTPLILLDDRAVIAAAIIPLNGMALGGLLNRISTHEQILKQKTSGAP